MSSGALLPLDPSEFVPLAPPLPDNSLAFFSDEELLHAILVIRLGCGRNKTILHDKHRKYICLLMRALDAEKRKRPSLNL